MAILEELPGIEITVVVAGRDAIEYDDPDASEHSIREAECPTSTKYIECVNDANFGVKYRLTKDYDWTYKNHCLHFSLAADGTRLRGTVITKDDFTNGEDVTEIYSKRSYNNITRRWEAQKFKFAAVTTVDDVSKDRIKSDMKVAKNLGTIELKVYRCRHKGYSLSTHDHHKAGNSSGYELSEKSLKGKAISHGTSFSTPEKTYTPRFVDVQDLDDGPVAVFRFNYRSRDALKREMIIPRSPSPNIARMSRAELEKLAQERLEQLQEGNDVKEERKPIIKRELKRKAEEVIDLSDDNPRPARSPVFVDLTDD
ncbi:uncharacterized protein F4807DRAFT_410917 [Annulohypoxylon truncatum]|uniref:uncharacterized protein n=1 Tax=Annulohypoxylon truncatum TaxID=327061 RepID=UPI002007AD09|nr:uncharacterized protein F4807DRAFT_410917 [Annulohypoxylon truncatum]KAI1213389.1 hypothetical protein F4807DRAFT_410917 [Annulohypoxylon truncatum]